MFNGQEAATKIKKGCLLWRKSKVSSNVWASVQSQSDSPG